MALNLTPPASEHSFVVVCELCGMVQELRHGGIGPYPSACQANAGGPHISPLDPWIYRAPTPHGARELWRQSQADPST